MYPTPNQGVAKFKTFRVDAPGESWFLLALRVNDGDIEHEQRHLDNHFADQLSLILLPGRVRCASLAGLLLVVLSLHIWREHRDSSHSHSSFPRESADSGLCLVSGIPALKPLKQQSSLAMLTLAVAVLRGPQEGGVYEISGVHEQRAAVGARKATIVESCYVLQRVTV